MKRASTKWIGLVTAGIAVTACGRTVEWKQETLLSDGRIVMVERVSKQTGNIVPENTSIEYEKTLAFTNPDTKERIAWTLPKGTGSYLLDFDKGIPYMVMSASSVADYNAWGCPNPPWIVFRYKEGNWSRIGVEQLPGRFITPNLLPAAKTLKDFPSNGLVTVQRMAEYLDQPGLVSAYRTISREKINPIAEGCHESVLHKQGRQSEIDTRR